MISKKILNDDNDHHPVTYASALFGAVALFSLIAYFLTGPKVQDFQNLFSLQVLPILLLNIVCYTVAPSFYYRALKKLPLSEVTILFALTGMYALLIGIVLGTESFVLSRFLGGALIIGSVAVVTLRDGHWKTSPHILMMVGATALYAIAAVTDTQIISNDYFSTLFFQMVSFGVPSIALLFLNPQSRQHLHKIYNRKMYPIILLNGAFFFVSFFAIYQAYGAGGNTSQVAFLLSSETIVMVLVAAAFLKERKDLALKLLAATAAMFGIFLLK